METFCDDILVLIFGRVTDGRDRKSCSEVCKRWFATEALTRVRVRILASIPRPEQNPNFLRRFINLTTLEALTRVRVRFLASIPRPEQNPNFLRRFINLTTLEMDTMVTDETLVFFSTAFPKLQTLNLSHDHWRIFESLVEDFGEKGLWAIAERCTELREVSLHHRCNVRDGAIVAFQHYGRDLTSLDLSQCGWLTDASVAVAADMRSLSRLNIGHCWRVTDLGLDFLSSWPAAGSLRVLDIACCEGITAAGVRLLRRLPLLEELILSNCCRRKLTDAAAAAVASTSSLRKLDLSFQYLILDRTLLAVGDNCRDLAILDLSYCSSINDASLVTVSGMGSLLQLYINFCVFVTDRGLDFLSTGPAAKSLRVLDISGCGQIMDAGVCHLKRLSCLEELMFLNHRRRQLSDVAGVAIASISTLRKLDLRMQDLITNATLIAVANNCRDLMEIRLYGCMGVMDKGLRYLAARCRLETIYTPRLGYLKKSSPSYLMDIIALCPSLRLLKVDSREIKQWFSPSQLETLSGICKVVWVG